jgi:CDP-diacylglycerol--glycerol-3-phosphate 3-phosphatidyltransferase
MDDLRQRRISRLVNVPNVLTTMRLILAVVAFVLVPLGLYLPALIVFVVAAVTDWIDGYWARRFDQVTQLGRIFDPFADKIIVCGLFVLLAAEEGSEIAPWMAVVVVGREMLVTALRGFIEQSGGDFSAKMAGKLKMVFQCAAIIASLVMLMYGADGAPDWLHWALPALVWLAVLSTIYSGLEYVFVATKYLLDEPEKK